MADDEIRMIDEGEDSFRHGYQPKSPKKIEEGYKPKSDPTPSNPPGGKKGGDGKSNAEKE